MKPYHKIYILMDIMSRHVLYMLQNWNALYQKASTSMQNRETKIEDAANLIEKDLTLLGATAVEDKLQDQVLY